MVLLKTSIRAKNKNQIFFLHGARCTDGPSLQGILRGGRKVVLKLRIRKYGGPCVNTSTTH